MMTDNERALASRSASPHGHEPRGSTGLDFRSYLIAHANIPLELACAEVQIPLSRLYRGDPKDMEHVLAARANLAVSYADQVIQWYALQIEQEWDERGKEAGKGQGK